MIAHDVPAKNKKSSKKFQAQVPVVKVSVESDSKESEESDAEKAGTDSPNEELESRKNVSTDDEMSSAAEGDESETDEDDRTVNSNLHQANPRWADAMKKVLSANKPKRKKCIVLSKAKKLHETLSKPKDVMTPFEIESKDGEVKREIVKTENAQEDSETLAKERKQKRQILGRKLRVKPSVLDREYEKRLQKIATNGVVQLFNAVRQQQKDIENKILEAGPLERKREKALKSVNRQTFLDVLMGGTNKLVDEPKESSKEDGHKKEDGVWDVLRDDFVMGAKMKDWNKEDESSEEVSSLPEEMDSD